jgi:hypothetical protein
MSVIFLEMSAMKHNFCTAFAGSVHVFCVSQTNLLLKPIMYLQTSVVLEIGALGTPQFTTMIVLEQHFSMCVPVELTQ